MKHLKSYNEGILDFFRSKSEDDKIALEFIKRLEKVEGISPYPLTYNSQGTDEDIEMMRYRVIFDDTPIRIGRYSVINPTLTRGFNQQTQKDWIQQGAVKKNNKLFYALFIETIDGQEYVSASWRVLEELYDLTEKVFKENKTAMRIKKIRDEINPAADKLDSEIYPVEESSSFREVKFTHKRNPRLEIIVTKSPDGRIVNIENESGIRFPFQVGQLLQRNVEVWACNNNFLMDGKDTCPEKKIFGVRAKDVPQGHEWRHIFPNKFK